MRLNAILGVTLMTSGVWVYTNEHILMHNFDFKWYWPLQNCGVHDQYIFLLLFLSLPQIIWEKGQVNQSVKKYLILLRSM